MILSDLNLAKRLERAEAYACAKFAEARGSEWIECAGAYAVYDGGDSPVTQCIGLGIFEPLTSAALDQVERFFHDRHAPTQVEMSPLAGVAAFDLLCSRGYRPIEISSVLYQPVVHMSSAANVRITATDEVELWSKTSARGWAPEHPELHEFLLGFGAAMVTREGSVCFLAEIDGQPGAAGALSIHEGVALFAGAATVPEFRRRGLQAALLQARMHYAAQRGCDLAMMVAEAGSSSQRNAERQGFRIAYTRIKWKLHSGW